MFARLGAPLQWGIDEPEALFAQYGWQATLTLPGEDGANFGRWPWPIPRDPQWISSKKSRLSCVVSMYMMVGWKQSGPK